MTVGGYCLGRGWLYVLCSNRPLTPTRNKYSVQGPPTTLGKADEGTLSASRAHIYGCRRQVGVAHGDCACPKLDTSKIRRRVGPPALLQCSDLGAQSAAAAGLQDAVKAARH